MRANALRDVVKLLVYTASATAMLTIYLIVPLMIVFGSTFRQSWSELLAALGTLALLEIPVVAILVKTCSPHKEAMHIEKRKAVRVPTGVGVEVGGARAAKNGLQSFLPGWAINASRGGLAILVGPEWRLHPSDHVTLRVELPQGTPVEAKARIVALEEGREDGRASRLLRLEIVAMDHEHKHRYLHYLAELEESTKVAWGTPSLDVAG